MFVGVRTGGGCRGVRELRRLRVEGPVVSVRVSAHGTLPLALVCGV